MSRWILLVLLAVSALFAEGQGRLESYASPTDFALTADPDSPNWNFVPGVTFAQGPTGEPAPDHRTEVRSRWSEGNLYLLFICPYQELYLKPQPDSAKETNKLWEWDVAEVFIGSDFEKITHYQEFQVSPQGEWVDLDIDRTKQDFAATGWLWNSGFEVKARIDKDRKIWYGEMRIPIKSIGASEPKPGKEFRINFYRIQGPPHDKIHVAWQPTGERTYHVPAAFGRLALR